MTKKVIGAYLKMDKIIMDILMYLGAADSRGFPLTWDILSSFMNRLGGHVRVIVDSA